MPVRVELSKLQASESPWRRSQAAIDLVALGESEAWSTLRGGLATRFLPGPAAEGERDRQRREQAAFAAAHLIVERAAKDDVLAQRYFGVEELGRQLSAERLARDAGSWPDDAPVGADLLGQVILEGLVDDPGRWNRFYWQYSCNLLCELGCRNPGASDPGRWCMQCLDGLESHYSSAGVAMDRSAGSCASGAL